MIQIGGQQGGLTSGLGESARGVIKPGIVAEWIASAQHRDVLIYARCEHLARGGAAFRSRARSGTAVRNARWAKMLDRPMRSCVSSTSPCS